MTACAQGLGSYSSIRQHHWKVHEGLLARLSLAPEPAALNAATLAAGKRGARESLRLGRVTNLLAQLPLKPQTVDLRSLKPLRTNPDLANPYTNTRNPSRT